MPNEEIKKLILATDNVGKPVHICNICGGTGKVQTLSSQFLAGSERTFVRCWCEWKWWERAVYSISGAFPFVVFALMLWKVCCG